LESYVFAIGLASGSFSRVSRYWVEKTPHNELYLPKILHWWPDARFLHVFRDPRDVFASYKRRAIEHKREIPSLDAFAHTWSQSAKAWSHYQQEVGRERYLVVRYEDLVLNLEQALNKIRKFLCIQDDPILRRPTKGHGRSTWGGNPADGQKQNHIYTSAIGKWGSLLEKEEVECIETLLRPWMGLLSYQTCRRTKANPYLAFLKIKMLLREMKFRVAHPWFI
jgi:hypothetical protein